MKKDFAARTNPVRPRPLTLAGSAEAESTRRVLLWRRLVSISQKPEQPTNILSLDEPAFSPRPQSLPHLRKADSRKSPVSLCPVTFTAQSESGLVSAALTATEFRILTILHYAERGFFHASKTLIESLCWPSTHPPDLAKLTAHHHAGMYSGGRRGHKKNLPMHLTKLRQKLQPLGIGIYLDRRGYRLIAVGGVDA